MIYKTKKIDSRSLVCRGCFSVISLYSNRWSRNKILFLHRDFYRFANSEFYFTFTDGIRVKPEVKSFDEQFDYPEWRWKLFHHLYHKWKTFTHEFWEIFLSRDLKDLLPCSMKNFRKQYWRFSGVRAKACRWAFYFYGLYGKVRNKRRNSPQFVRIIHIIQLDEATLLTFFCTSWKKIVKGELCCVRFRMLVRNKHIKGWIELELMILEKNVFSLIYYCLDHIIEFCKLLFV